MRVREKERERSTEREGGKGRRGGKGGKERESDSESDRESEREGQLEREDDNRLVVHRMSVIQGRFSLKQLKFFSIIVFIEKIILFF